MDSSSDIQTIRHLKQENFRLKAENSSMRDYVERLQRTFSALVDLQQNIDAISVETNVFLLIHEVLTSAMRAVDSPNGTLMLLDDETGELVFVEVIGDARDKLLNFRLPKGVGIAGDVVRKQRARMVSNAKSEHTFTPMVDQYTGMETKSILCVPLLDGKRTLGAIEVINTRTGNPFKQADLEILQVVGRLAAVAIKMAEKEAA